MDWKEKADNPLVFVVILAFAIFGVAKVGQVVGKKTGLNGLSNFFGGNNS